MWMRPEESAPEHEAGSAAEAVSSAAQEVAEKAGEAGVNAAVWMSNLPGWPGQEDLLRLCGKMHPILAAVLVMLGLLYLVFGYSIFRMLVMLNFAALGAWGGWELGLVLGAPVPVMVVCGVFAAAVAWPMMRYMVALCGGIVGFVVGVTVWRSCGLADTYAAAGGAIGAVFLSMLSFIGFKATIIAFTCVQGAVLLVGGMIALALQVEAGREEIPARLTQSPVILPIVLFVLSIMGIVFQQTWNKPGDKDKKKA